VVWVEGNLQRLDLSDRLKLGLQVFVSHFLWNTLDENVVGDELLLVVTKELLVELEGSALLSVDGEVSHLFTGLLELSGVLDVDDGGVERSGDVSSELWLDVEVNLGLVLESLCDLLGTDVGLWKVVQVDEVLVLVSEWLKHFIFIFLKCKGFVLVF
jgi:hypothetical protein